MTALTKYARLEAAGLWRSSPEEQRRDVIVSIGDSTLIITDMADRPLAHWSIPAVQRANPDELPALFYPDGNPGETLELAGDETDMLAAIETLRTAVTRGQARPGRLRLVSLLATLTALAALAVFWLPGALLTHTVEVVPPAKRTALGNELLEQTTRFTGPPCSEPQADRALKRLAARLDVPRVLVVRDGVRDAVTLPGGTVLVNRALVEDYADPDVIAGYIVAETMQAGDPLHRLLSQAGVVASFRLLTTGAIPPDVLRGYAERMLTAPDRQISDEALLASFAAQRLRSSPYAYALDITGETTLPLIEADPFETTPDAVLGDGDWVALQGICGG
ncbi:hypothetical protein SAMN04490248_10644 [Salinihabitans flavidus]|uniref:Uncharacterized protein n=1 Tax=Salinihabitans flavidus TaxID=569882 RepID=A0A1H8Q898_9RHOB|nr:hypothetical protein [Salinihabitans flavidus]SEO50191.1 hypothetical protein SAMN04490248_10644 [Salinihabitans flavidus]